MIRFDDYVIDADSQSVNAYRMSKSVSKKTGETTETQSLVGYYGTLEGAAGKMLFGDISQRIMPRHFPKRLRK